MFDVNILQTLGKYERLNFVSKCRINDEKKNTSSFHRDFVKVFFRRDKGLEAQALQC